MENIDQKIHSIEASPDYIQQCNTEHEKEQQAVKKRAPVSCCRKYRIDGTKLFWIPDYHRKIFNKKQPTTSKTTGVKHNDSLDKHAYRAERKDEFIKTLSTCANSNKR